MQRSQKFKNYTSSILTALLLLSIPSSAFSQDNYDGSDEVELSYEDLSVTFNYPPESGPKVFRLSNRAELFVPEGYSFLGEQGTMMTMHLMENVLSGKEVGMIISEAEDEDWYAVFSFDETGYVTDKDKGDLDPDELLDWMQGGLLEHNMQRRKNNWATMEIKGWEIPPSYDPSSGILEWAIVIQSDGDEFVNHDIRILGRHGVMTITLATSAAELRPLLQEFHRILEGFDFQSGERYSEFVEGDSLAGFGLASLVAGGMSIESAETESTGWPWKNIGRVLLIGLGLTGVIFARFFKRKNQEFTNQEALQKKAKQKREPV